LSDVFRPKHKIYIPAELAGLPQDILLTRLENYTRGGAFTGQYDGPGRSEIEANFEHNLALFRRSGGHVMREPVAEDMRAGLVVEYGVDAMALCGMLP
jgi:hypothetical protein